jgi:hypothetical protein
MRIFFSKTLKGYTSSKLTVKFIAIYILFFLILSACETSKKLDLKQFDKKKWKSSSEYRWEINRGHFFPDLRGRSKRVVRKVLGEPDFIDGERYSYCFTVITKSKKKHQNICKDSFINVYFINGKVFDIITVNID